MQLNGELGTLLKSALFLTHAAKVRALMNLATNACAVPTEDMLHNAWQSLQLLTGGVSEFIGLTPYTLQKYSIADQIIIRNKGANSNK